MAVRTGARPMTAPEVMPKRAVKTMRAPLECVGIRTPRTRTVLRAANVIITLK